MSKNLVAELTVSELHNMLNNALLFVSKDKTTPTLQAVHITAYGAELKATATDRYKIGQVLGRAESVEPCSLLLPVELVKQVIGILKAVPRANADKHLARLWHEISDADLELIERGYDPAMYPGILRVELSNGSVVSGELADSSQFPKLNSLFPAPQRADDALGVHLIDPLYVADMMKVKHVDGSSKGMPTRVTGGYKPGKPVVFEHGGWFRGLIQPMKSVDAHPNFSERFEFPANPAVELAA